MAEARPAVLALLVGALLAPAALLTSGCSSKSSPATTGRTPAHAPHAGGPRAGGMTIPAPAPTGTPASPGAVKVIEGWSSALRRGDLRSAATYFRLPSELINGIGAGGSVALIRIHSLTQAEAANETLPCGAKFISADQRGPYVNALFALTGRPGPGGSSCGSGAGQTARTNFLIEGGRILQWIRAPDAPGDNRPSSPTTPATPQGPAGGAPVV
ncbi:MAG: hypothetical protein ACR2MK_07085 [Solirubrobacteraceae bacterium]